LQRAALGQRAALQSGRVRDRLKLARRTAMPLNVRLLFVTYVPRGYGEQAQTRVVMLPKDENVEPNALPSTAVSLETGLHDDQLDALQRCLTNIGPHTVQERLHTRRNAHAIAVGHRWSRKAFADLNAVERWAENMLAIGFGVVQAVTAAQFYEAHWDEVDAPATLDRPDAGLVRDVFIPEPCQAHGTDGEHVGQCLLGECSCDRGGPTDQAWQTG